MMKVKSKQNINILKQSMINVHLLSQSALGGKRVAPGIWQDIFLGRLFRINHFINTLDGPKSQKATVFSRDGCSSNSDPITQETSIISKQKQKMKNRLALLTSHWSRSHLYLLLLFLDGEASLEFWIITNFGKFSWHFCTKWIIFITMNGKWQRMCHHLYKVCLSNLSHLSWRFWWPWGSWMWNFSNRNICFSKAVTSGKLVGATTKPLILSDCLITSQLCNCWWSC